MRPMRFQATLQTMLTGSPAITGVRIPADDPRLDNAVEVTLASGARLMLTTIGSAAPGANDYSVPEEIVEGDPLPAVPPVHLDTSNGVRVADVGAFLAAAITNAGSKEISAVQVMAPNSPPEHAIEVAFHSGAKVWIYLRHALRAGEQPSPQQAYKVKAAI
ncbi:hypothetical protein [Nonomuraea sp. SBT364]|uniref:hypothetical protein n=1 Tax=Nonomuraea sp. SBT364 TaxID=1580530 RepID=UPI00066B9D26|nr:hypothetical protein [Nonomuraea sp. SBT364]